MNDIRKTNTTSVHAASRKSAVSPLGFFCIGFGAIVGVGWDVSINGWMADCGGPLPAAAGYILALVMMIPIALCYCELVPMLPVAGGGMAFSYKAFGEKVALISGWAAFGAFIWIIPWESIQVTEVLGYSFPVLTKTPVLYELAGSKIYLASIVIGVICSLLMFALNRRGLESAAKVQKFLCIFLLVIAIAAAVIAVVGGSPKNLYPVYDNSLNPDAYHHSFFGGALSILAAAPFFLAGFETIPQGIEEAGGNVKKVGKTVVLSVFIACIFYAVLIICLGSGIPWKQFAVLKTPAGANLFIEMYPGTFGVILYWLDTIGALAGLFTTWNGFFLASANLLMGMARGNMVPKVFAKQDKNGIPINGLYACLALSLAGPFLGSGLIGSITSFSGIAFVLSWFLTACSLVQLRKTMPDAHRPYKIPGGKAMGAFAAAAAGIVLILSFVPGNPVYVGSGAVTMFAIWMAAGIILYVSCTRERNAIPAASRAHAMFAHVSEAVEEEEEMEHESAPSAMPNPKIPGPKIPNHNYPNQNPLA